MSAPLSVEAGSLRAELSEAGSLVAIDQSGVRFEFADDGWEVAFDGERFESGSLRPTGTEAAVDGLTVHLADETRDVHFSVRYEARVSAEHELLLRTIIVHPPHPGALEFVSFHSASAGRPTDRHEIRTFSEAPFAAALRVDDTTLLTGVQNPHGTVTFDDEGLAVSYEPALQIGDVFVTSPQFFAVVRQSGVTVQPVTPKTRIGVGETRARGRFRNPTESFALDRAEIASLRAVVRDFLAPLPEITQFILYTYWTPLPQIPESADDARLWMETIDAFAGLGGQLLLTVPLVRAAVPTLDPQSYWDLEPEGSVAERILGHARSRGLGVGYYMGVAAGNLPFGNEPGLGLPLDGPTRWRKVGDDGTLFQENCLADDDYREWLTTAQENTIRRFGLAAWSWDPGPGDGRNCASADHGHLPGRGEHKGWLEGQQMIARLHDAFPGLHLQGFYGQKQDGTWGMRGITQHEGYWEQQIEWGAAIYPDLSAERQNANGVRQQAWWSQNFRFLPSEINHALFGRMSQMCLEDPALGRVFDHWGWRFGLLSAIAVGGSPEASTIPFGEVPDAVRREYRSWIAWANGHHGPWRVDIAGGAQVQIGGVDWYLRANDDGSWLFACNPGGRPASLVISPEELPASLDAAGRSLRRRAPHELDLIALAGGGTTIPDSGRIEFDVPPYEVWVLELTERGAVSAVGAAAEPPPLDSVAIPLDGWDEAWSLQLPGIPVLTQATRLPHSPERLRADHPDFPETFAWADSERVTLMIPLLDADAAKRIGVRIAGQHIELQRFALGGDQMRRFGVPADVRAEWPETGIVWWCDLTDVFAGDPLTLELELPSLPDGQFLGPVLQVPRRLAPLFAASVDRAVRYLAPVGGATAVRPPAGDPGPRVTAAWTEPAVLASDIEFSITARAEGATAVFASTITSGSNMFDLALTEDPEHSGLWRATARTGDRTAIILDPRDFVLWATDAAGTVGADHRFRAQWKLDALRQ